MVSRSRTLNSPFGWIRSERKVPELRMAQSALVAVKIMSVIKFPKDIKNVFRSLGQAHILMFLKV